MHLVANEPRVARNVHSSSFPMTSCIKCCIDPLNLHLNGAIERLRRVSISRHWNGKSSTPGLMVEFRQQR